jgi:hypothetical protein
MGADSDRDSSPEPDSDALAESSHRDVVDARRGRTDGSSAGTDGPDRSAEVGERPGDDADWPTAVYRWACPICGETGMGIASDRVGPAEKAAVSLRQHVRGTEDDDHGPRNVFPDGFEPADVDGYVAVG